MKRTVALSVLVIFLLNVFGYYGIFMGLRSQLAVQMRANLDESNYALSDEITFKVPIAIPYASDMTDYQRVDGEFRHEGNVYRLLKQKLLKDTLYIVCVKDMHAQKIDKALEDYVKTFSDKPSTEKSGSKTLDTFSKDFLSHVISIEPSQTGWVLASAASGFESEKTIQISSEIIQPPKI
jgi:hypothetical protein